MSTYLNPADAFIEHFVSLSSIGSDAFKVPSLSYFLPRVTLIGPSSKQKQRTLEAPQNKSFHIKK
jgi:hypothetical protein